MAALITANTWLWFHLVRELNALHLCVYSCCLSTSAYKTFCEVMEMKEVKIAGVQHWHLSTELWTGSWTNNQEKQVSFDGQSCQHRLLVKRVNKERDREREEMTYSNCAERQILICLFSDSFQLLFSGQSGSPNYFIRAGMDLCNSVKSKYITVYSAQRKWVHPLWKVKF